MTPNYRVELLPSAARQQRRLPRPAQKQVAAILAGLSVDPWPPGFKPLVGAPGMLRVRSGSYRVIYQVAHRSKLLVMVVWVGNRRDAYRHLRR